MSEKKISVSLEGRMDSLSSTLKQAEVETERHTRAMASDFSRVDGGVMSVGRSLGSLAVATGISGAVMGGFGRELVGAALAAERLNMQFKASTGSVALAGAELSYIRDLAQKLGLDFQSTAQSYSKFLAATKNTAIEGEPARRVFEGVSAAVTALSLSTDDANGIFYALNQMMSKGKVSAEELRQQLGERLPGAARLAAEAMGMTTREFDKQMAQGNILAEDLLPKLASMLQKTYGDAASEAATKGQAAINRMNNEIREMKTLLGESILPAFVDWSTGAVNSVELVIRKIAEAKIIWTGWAKEFGIMMKGGPLGTNWLTSKGRAEIAAEMEAQEQMTVYSLQKLNERFDGASSPVPPKGKKGGGAPGGITGNDKGDKTQELYNAYSTALDGYNKQLRALNPNLDEFDRKMAAIDEQLASQLEKFTGFEGNPGVQKYIASLKDAAAQTKLAIMQDEDRKNNAILPYSQDENSASYLNVLGQMSEGQQEQFDKSAMRNKWMVAQADYDRKEEQAAFDHNRVLASITESSEQAKLMSLGRQEEALLSHFNFEQQQAALQLQWTLDHTALDEEQKAQIIGEYNAKRIQAEQEKSLRLGEIWWNDSQKYIGFAENMTTMGIQMLLFDEDQKNQIGRRMLATSLRFVTQGLQQYMMGKAKEHVLNAAGMAGAITTKVTQAETEMAIGAEQATAWAAYFSAMSMNPYGGQAFVPAATAMTAAAAGFGVATGTIAATGAGGIASELGMAAAWGAGGIAVGALGEAGATSIEGGTSGSTSAAGYGAGSPASPVVTQPQYGTGNQQPLTVYFNFSGVMTDSANLSRWMEESMAPLMRDLTGRNVIFIPREDP